METNEASDTYCDRDSNSCVGYDHAGGHYYCERRAERGEPKASCWRGRFLYELSAYDALRLLGNVCDRDLVRRDEQRIRLLGDIIMLGLHADSKPPVW